MPDGIIIVDKPQDWTSMDVCAGAAGSAGAEARTGMPCATAASSLAIRAASPALEPSSEGSHSRIRQISATVRLLPERLQSSVACSSSSSMAMSRSGGIFFASVFSVASS